MLSRISCCSTKRLLNYQVFGLYKNCQIIDCWTKQTVERSSSWSKYLPYNRNGMNNRAVGLKSCWTIEMLDYETKQKSNCRTEKQSNYLRSCQTSDQIPWKPPCSEALHKPTKYFPCWWQNAAITEPFDHTIECYSCTKNTKAFVGRVQWHVTGHLNIPLKEMGFQFQSRLNG